MAMRRGSGYVRTWIPRAHSKNFRSKASNAFCPAAPLVYKLEQTLDNDWGRCVLWPDTSTFLFSMRLPEMIRQSRRGFHACFLPS